MILSPGQLLAPVSFLLRFLLSLDDRSSDHLSLLPLALDGHLNANAASSSPPKAGDEGFDGRGGSYPANAGCLPTGSWVDEGIKFTLPQDWTTGKKDHILSDGQTLHLPRPVESSALHMLVAGDFFDGNSQESVTLVFKGGEEREVSFVVKNWWSIHWLNKASIRCPYHLNPAGHNWNASSIYHVSLPLHPSSSSLSNSTKIKAIRLPPSRETNRLHVFAMTLVLPTPSPQGADRPSLQVRHVRASSRWTLLADGRKAQTLEIAVSNQAPPSSISDAKAWLREPLEISLEDLPDGFESVQKGRVTRLMPGDERMVEILVAPTGKEVSSTGLGSVSVLGTFGDGSKAEIQAVAEGGCLVSDWEAFWLRNNTSLDFHESPKWFSDAKLGIFIHWGLFSVPAWMDRGRYAEWYWHYLHEDAESNVFAAWQHHLETHGPDFTYDDFIPSFGQEFDAEEWIRLFVDAGAKYFVLTTKHHDGFALFDTGNTSDRSSVKLAPGGRDYIKELFAAADKSDGALRKGTYFSMPEWYNPDYARYGWERFPGGLPPDVFHPGVHEPYTGWHSVGDYVEDMQLQQMRILADMGTDIMWCDIGGANHSSALLSKWYSSTSAQGRQVTTNNRCGVAPDFDTPEYERFATAQPRTWETCEGIDPYSFGYNQRTKDDEYRSSEELIHNLVDITSKGGNYLLNIGPTGQGKIIDVMQTRLRELGAWLKINGEAIYNTEPFPLLSEFIDDRLDLDLRFTRTATSFYITSLNATLPPVLTIPAYLPVLEGDELSLLVEGAAVPLQWTYTKQAVLRIEIPKELRAIGQAAVVFRVKQL